MLGQGRILIGEAAMERQRLVMGGDLLVDPDPVEIGRRRGSRIVDQALSSLIE